MVDISSNWLWALPLLFTVLSAISFRADKIPYLREWLFPVYLKQGKEHLDADTALGKEGSPNEFQAVMDALRNQKMIPKGMLEADIRRLATESEPYGPNKFLMAYIVGENRPWHVEQDRWNQNSSSEGTWEMLAPYSRVHSAITTQIEANSFPKNKVGVGFLLLFVISSIIAQIM